MKAVSKYSKYRKIIFVKINFIIYTPPFGKHNCLEFPGNRFADQTKVEISRLGAS